MNDPRYPLSLELRREGERIYFVFNLRKIGYWTLEDFAQFQYFGDGFWEGKFERIIFPQLRGRGEEDEG